MKNIFKRLFGKKEKPKEETPLLPIKDEEQPISVPIEENIFDKENLDIRLTEQILYDVPIAPTLERQGITLDEISEIIIEDLNKPKKETVIPISFETKKTIEEFLEKENKKKKSTKPKKQAIKKDKFNDDASKPKGRNFLM